MFNSLLGKTMAAYIDDRLVKMLTIEIIFAHSLLQHPEFI